MRNITHGGLPKWGWIVKFQVGHEMSISPNNSIHADCQKRRGFRSATATPLLAAGDARRYVL